jgi:tripartite-type tricarboxylate transporter receptor subunit TctC
VKHPDRRKITAALAALALAAFGQAGAALAQSYPDKPITMLVGYNAGGQTDLVARAAAKVLSDELGQPVNVVNKPGAGGGVAARELTQAPPDGYTIMFHANSVVNQDPFLMKRITFTPEDFEWAGFITVYQAGLITQKDAPYDDLDGFVAWAKENPGFAYATLSPGARMIMQEIAKKEGLEVNYVPVKGGGEMINAILGKQSVLAMSGGLHAKYPDDIKTLAVLTTFRQPSWPEAKSIDEYGYKLAMDGRAGIMAPKGTPPEVIERLSDALAKAETDETFAKVTGAADIPIMYLNATEAKAEIERTYREYGDIFRNAGIEPQ